jgi:putative acetyltransferase
MLIRRESPDDRDAISAVITAAFRPAPEAPVPAETELVERLRADAGWLARLSFVAVAEGTLLGHVVCTRGHVDHQPALGLGPL